MKSPVLVCAIALAVFASVPASARAPKYRILVPAYFYPAGAGLKEWDRLLRSPHLDATIIIANPGNGPGEAVDSNYTRVLDRAHATTATVIGYVYTGYAKRSVAEVKADIDRWLRLYPTIQGIFVDEQASAPTQADYYRALYDYVRTEKKLSLVVSNPGTVCDEVYLSKPCANITCLFESPYKSTSLDLPAWTTKYPVAMKNVLPYGVTTAPKMREVVRQAAARSIGVLYVTDATGENPWKRLPKYWEDEVAAVADLNRKP